MSDRHWFLTEFSSDKSVRYIKLPDTRAQTGTPVAVIRRGKQSGRRWYPPTRLEAPDIVARMFESADAYDRFMGRYSTLLAHFFVDFAGVIDGQTVLDVGSGPGALTRELIARLGDRCVTAVDPSPQFIDAIHGRHPEIDARVAPAEDLPWEDDSFDACLSQLVVHFMTSPVEGLREMRRVTRHGGTIAACVWDLAGGRSPVSPFWEAASQVGRVIDESDRPGAREGHLAELFAAAGLDDIRATSLTIEIEHSSFEEWWEPFTLGVGPAGAHFRSLADPDRERLREACLALVTHSPRIPATAWAVAGQA